MPEAPERLTEEQYIEYFADPDWYKKFTPEMEYYFRGEDPQDKEALERFDAEKRRLRELFMKLYDEDRIAFGSEGLDLDKDRQPVDTLVVHHTAGNPDVPWQYINMQHLFSLYIPMYLEQKRRYYGQPIWSNHFLDGKMVFCGYHYLIWHDGRTEHILNDSQIGWHAGDWDVNKRSVAICFVGNLTDSTPTEEAMEAANRIISQYPNTRILGHREVMNKTECPGNLFLGENGWKNRLAVQP